MVITINTNHEFTDAALTVYDPDGKVLYKGNGRVVVTTRKIAKCRVCGTTENLREDGWYGYRCNSTDCVCF